MGAPPGDGGEGTDQGGLLLTEGCSSNRDSHRQPASPRGQPGCGLPVSH